MSSLPERRQKFSSRRSEGVVYSEVSSLPDLVALDEVSVDTKLRICGNIEEALYEQLCTGTSPEGVPLTPAQIKKLREDLGALIPGINTLKGGSSSGWPSADQLRVYETAQRCVLNIYGEKHPLYEEFEQYCKLFSNILSSVYGEGYRKMFKLGPNPHEQMQQDTE
jgi:hypothetical protein